LIVIDQSIKDVNEPLQDYIGVQADKVMDGDLHVCLHTAKLHFRVETECLQDDIFITEDDSIEVKYDKYVFKLNRRLPTYVTNVINNKIFDDDNLRALNNVLKV
jgi:hypothetical protein